MVEKGTVVKGMAAKGTPVFPKVIPIGTSYEIQKTADISRSAYLFALSSVKPGICIVCFMRYNKDMS